MIKKFTNPCSSVAYM